MITQDTEAAASGRDAAAPLDTDHGRLSCCGWWHNACSRSTRQHTPREEGYVSGTTSTDPMPEQETSPCPRASAEALEGPAQSCDPLVESFAGRQHVVENPNFPNSALLLQTRPGHMRLSSDPAGFFFTLTSVMFLPFASRERDPLTLR